MIICEFSVIIKTNFDVSIHLYNLVGSGSCDLKVINSWHVNQIKRNLLEVLIVPSL